MKTKDQLKTGDWVVAKKDLLMFDGVPILTEGKSYQMISLTDITNDRGVSHRVIITSEPEFFDRWFTIDQPSFKEPRIEKIGTVGVDSGQLILCDPSYFKSFGDYDSFHGHEVYQHEGDGKLWQFTYGQPSPVKGVNIVPGTYAEVIPEYSKSMNDLISEGVMKKTDLDPRPNVPDGEFSYRGACKATLSKEQAGQLNLGVAFSSGLGDGEYDVFATYQDCGPFGERITEVTVVLVTPEELEELRKEEPDGNEGN